MMIDAGAKVCGFPIPNPNRARNRNPPLFCRNPRRQETLTAELAERAEIYAC
jgi:hypothetical protein